MILKNTYILLFLVALFSKGLCQNNPIHDNQKNVISRTASEAIKNLPVSFRKNMGQWDDKILYQGFSPGWQANINFMKEGLSFGLSRKVEGRVEKGKNETEHKNRMEVDVKPTEQLIWNFYFKGMNSNASISPEGSEDSHVNYMTGNDASKYQINVPDYKVVNYTNVYDNIDIKYYSTGKNIKYDCILKPGADIRKIQMECRGIQHVRVNQKKQLEIINAWGTLIEEMPESYQIINGKKTLIAVEYVELTDNTFGFKVTGAYDPSQTLIIDPVILEWGTFFGASGTDEGYCYAVAVDPAGNVYCTGFYEANFPVTPGAYNTTGQAQQNVFVIKFNPTATALIYATYLAGTANDWGYGIVANAAGEAYVTGRTASPNFPVTAGAYQTTFAGGSGFDAFVTKLNPTGTALVYSTFIGGNKDDEGFDIKINPAGEVFITGVASTGFPVTAGVFQATIPAGYGAMIAKLNAAGSALVYAGILGGSLGNYGYGIAIDPTGAAYVTGETGAWANTPPTYTDFPLTPGAFDMNYGNCGWKGFITKINPAGSAIVYSSLLGGQGNCPITSADLGAAVAVNAAGEAFVTGTAGSGDYPATAGAYDLTHNGVNGNPNIFVTRLNASGTAAIYSTFYGGNMGATVCGIAINSANEAFISGYTETDDGSFPITACAYQPVFGGQSTATKRGDIFIAKFNSTGTTLQYSTFVGGNSDDYQIPKIVLYGACEEEVIVNGTSHSANFPTTPGVFQPTKLNGGNDQPVVFKMKPDVKANFTWTKPPCSKTVTFTDSSYGNCNWQSGAWTPGTWLWYFGDGTTSTQQNPVHTYTAFGTYSVTLVVSCPKDSITIPITVANTSAGIGGNTTICQGNTATLTASGGSSYSWSTGASSSSIMVTPSASTNYTVIVTSGACADTIPINVLVSAAVLSYTATPANCGGANGTASVTVTGGGPPYTYQWSPSGGTSSSASGLSPGNYTVTVTDAGGCSNTQTVSVTTTGGFSVTATSTPSGCSVATGTANANPSSGTPPYTYAWTNGQTTSTATGLAAGNYSVAVTDASGCSGTTTVTVGQPSSISSTVVSVPDACSQAVGTATATGTGGSTPYSYLWSNGQTASTATGLSSATYTVVVTDANGCSFSNTVFVGNGGNASANAGVDISVLTGSSATLTASGGVNYSWNTGQITNPIVVSPVATTSYVVTVTDANGCTGMDTIIVYVIEPIVDCSQAENPDVFILPNAFSPNGDNNNERFHLLYGQLLDDCVKEIYIAVYNRWGEKVFESDLLNFSWDGTFKDKPEESAVFGYYMKAVLTNKAEVKRKGNVSLLR